MKKYKLTLIGLFLATIISSITLTFKLDLFELVIETLISLEEYEIDEFIIPVILLLVFSFFDQIRIQRLQKIEYEKVKIYRAMLESTRHILNNFLNQVQLFKITAENTPNFDPEVLSLYDVVIKDASIQIEALGSITNIDEKSIHESVEPKLKL